MSQYPQQQYPNQGPPMQGPPMGGPPMYAPPPKKTGIILLVLGILALVIGGILTIIGLGGVGAAASGIEKLQSGQNTFLAPGEGTLTLTAGTQMIMSVDGGEYNGTTYTPTDAFPNNSTVFKVTGPDGVDVPVVSAQMQASGNSGSSSANAVRQFDAPTAGQYVVSITNPDGMEQRPIMLLSLEEMMKLGMGALAGVGGLACGAPLAIIGIILIIVWIIVRK